MPGTSFNADVGHIANGKLHITEVCNTAIDNIVDHVRACLLESIAVETVTIATANNATGQKARQLIKGTPEISGLLDRIKFESIEKVMKELFP